MEIHNQYPELSKSAQASDLSAKAAYTLARPWLKIDSVELREGAGTVRTLMVDFPDLGITMPPELQVKITVKNVGKTVAQDVHIFPELYLKKYNGSTWYDAVTQEENRFCSSVLNWEANGAMSVVYPSESVVWNMGASSTIQPPENSAAALIISVSYSGQISRSQTQAWFELYEDQSTVIKNGTDVNASRLHLTRVETGDHAF